MTRVTCPGCRRALQLPDGAAIPLVQCPACGTQFQPDIVGAAAPEPPLEVRDVYAAPTAPPLLPTGGQTPAFAAPPVWANATDDTASPAWLLVQAVGAPLCGGLAGVLAAVAAHLLVGAELTFPKLLLGPFFLAAGCFGMAAAACDWEWFFTSFKAQALVGYLGRGMTRCCYGLLGAGMALFGLGCAVVPWGAETAVAASPNGAAVARPTAGDPGVGRAAPSDARTPAGITIPRLRDGELEQTIDVFNEFADVLATITDRASAERAADKVTSLALQRHALERALALRDEALPEADRQRFAEMYDADLTEAKDRVVRETARVMAIAGAADVLRERLALAQLAADGGQAAGQAATPPLDLAAAPPGTEPATPGVGQPIPPRELPPEDEEDDAPTITFGGSSLTQIGGAAGPWSVEPDPAPENPELAAYQAPSGNKAFIPFPEVFGGGTAYYPSTPSQFVAVGGFFFQDGMIEVWNLATRKRAGRLPGGPQLSEPFAVSPDGRYFAGAGPNFGQSVQVWSFETGQGLWSFDLGDKRAEYVDFAGGELITAALSAGHFQVWNLEDGELAREFKAPAGAVESSVALSPGGRYLTAHMKDQGMLQFYDLKALELAGELAIPKHDDWNLDCRAVAFSPDGRELAGLFEAWGLNHLLVWDLATGDELLHHTYSKDLQWLTNVFYNGPGLDWVPDGSGWLIFGNALLDRQTGELLLTFPDDPQKSHPRRMLTPEHFLAVVTAANNALALQVVPLPLEEIAAARAKAQEKSAALAAELPPLTPVDWSGARAIPVADGPTPWNVIPDSPSALDGAVVAGPIELSVKREDVRKVLLTGAGSPQAVVWSVPKEQPGDAGLVIEGRAYNWIDRYDLASGQSLARTEILAAIEALDVSADGAHFLAADAKKERLDVWAFGAGHVAAWAPYADEPADRRAVTWAAFDSAGRVLTLNSGGKLVAWNVDGCRPEYFIDRAGPAGWGVLSANRRLLVVGQGRTLRVFDTGVGARVGELESTAVLDAFPGQPALQAAAFSDDGRELAAVFRGTADGRPVRKLGRWDLSEGRFLGEFVVPDGWGTPSTLRWCGTMHLLLDDRHLLDTERRRHVWNYQISWGGLGAQGQLDGRYWFTAADSGSEHAFLAAVRLPEAEVVRQVGIVTGPDVKPLLAEGAVVGLALNFGGPPRDAAGFKKRVEEQIAAGLALRGIGLGAGQGVSLAATVREVNTGETMRLDELFGGKTHDVPLIDLACTLTLTSGGKVVWSAEHTVHAYRVWGFLHLPPGEDDPGAYLRCGQWDEVAGWLVGTAQGVEVYQLPNGTAVVFPGASELAPYGPITQPLVRN